MSAFAYKFAVLTTSVGRMKAGKVLKYVGAATPQEVRDGVEIPYGTGLFESFTTGSLYRIPLKKVRMEQARFRVEETTREFKAGAVVIDFYHGPQEMSIYRLVRGVRGNEERVVSTILTPLYP